MSRPTLLLADDHRIITEGLTRLLENDFEIVAVAHDGEALFEAAQRFRPEVIVSDVSMPLLTGFHAVEKLRATGITAHVIFLTMHAETDFVIRAFEAGAAGFVLKNSAGRELVNAIQQVCAGDVYLSPYFLRDPLAGILDEARQRNIALHRIPEE